MKKEPLADGGGEEASPDSEPGRCILVITADKELASRLPRNVKGLHVKSVVVGGYGVSAAIPWTLIEDVAVRSSCRVVLAPPSTVDCSAAIRVWRRTGVVVVEGSYDIIYSLEWVAERFDSLSPCEKPTMRVRLPEVRSGVRLGCGLSIPLRGPPALIAAEVVVKHGWERRLEAAAHVTPLVVVGASFSTSVEELRSALRRARELSECVALDAPPETASKVGLDVDVYLSVSPSMLSALTDIPAEAVVAIPASIGERLEGSIESRLERLARVAREAERAGYQVIADPLLSPPCLGLSDSIVAYYYAARRLPYPLLAGLGNVYELIDADDTGVLGVLAAILLEIGVSVFLVTAESWKALTAYEDAVVATALASAACIRRVPPKDFDITLLDARCKRPTPGFEECKPHRSTFSEASVREVLEALGRCCHAKLLAEELWRRKRLVEEYRRIWVR